MKYIIFDLEFNSAFKIDRRTKQLVKGNVNPLCPQEIIEIGAVKTNSRVEIEDTFQIFIKPQLYTKLNPKVKKKTSITNQDLLSGLFFEDSIDMLKKWLIGDVYVMCSWGTDDINELKRNCDYFNISTDWIDQYIDIQKMCTNYLNLPKGTQIGLKKAVETFNIQVDNKFHKALNDSIYTAKVFEKINNSHLYNL